MNGQGVKSADATKNEALKYLTLLWGRKWWIVVPAILGLVGATLYSMTLTDRFRSQMVILVTPQKVPEAFVPSTVTTNIQDRLNTIRQQILSRTRLEQIIDEFGLFSDPDESRPMEVLVGVMRDNMIGVKVHRGRGTQSFEVSFTHSDPQIAMQVTNRLASLFIEENLKVREQQAMGTSQFLAGEIELSRAKIQVREKQITAFRRKHMNELPERTASNQARLSQLQNQLQMNVENINAAEDRKVLLQQQISETERRTEEAARQLLREADQAAWRARSSATTISGPGSGGPSPLEQELIQARDQLTQLRLVYTDKHPDVVRLAGRVSQLEEQLQVRLSTPGANTLEQQAVAVGDDVAPTPVEEVPSVGTEGVDSSLNYPDIYYEMISDVRALEMQVSRLLEENVRIRDQIEMYQKRLAATPVREMELRQLSEEFGGLKAQLNSLVENKLRADLSENLEKKQKGEQFRILDPASFPEKPVSPNRIALVGAGLVGGGGLGCGVVLLLDLMIAGVRNRQDLRDFLDVPVFAIIPEIITAEDVRRRRLRRLGVLGAVSACVMVALVIVHVKVYPLPAAAEMLYGKALKTHWTAIR